MFTIVHLHLVLNHLPILITALGLLLVAIAAWRSDDYLARVALAFFVGGALSALPTYLTGEGAEDAVKNLPGVTKALIEQHSDIALIAAIVVGVLGAFALWALWRYRRPAILPVMIVRAILVGAVAGAGLMAYAGLLGGEIRHTEVRSGYVPAAEGAAGAGGSSAEREAGERGEKR
jgi:uncharacterized membrane protein